MALLDTPVKFQPDDHSCGATALLMALEYDGLTSSRWIRQLSSPVVGMTAEVLTAAAHAAYGGHILSGTMDVPLLKHLTARGRPVLCLITDPVGGGGHWTLVRGVQRGRVYLSCPSRGRESLPAAAWEACWHLADQAGQWRLDRYGVVGLPATG